ELHGGGYGARGLQGRARDVRRSHSCTGLRRDGHAWGCHLVLPAGRRRRDGSALHRSGRHARDRSLLSHTPGCDDPGPRRRMRVVNAVTTSWPALRLDRPTFSAVAESELDAVHRYLLFLTGNRTVAEDLTGETFERFFRVGRRFDPRRGTARAWLCGIARTTALDHFRSADTRRPREGRCARELPA